MFNLFFKAVKLGLGWLYDVLRVRYSGSLVLLIEDRLEYGCIGGRATLPWLILTDNDLLIIIVINLICFCDLLFV